MGKKEREEKGRGEKRQNSSAVRSRFSLEGALIRELQKTSGFEMLFIEEGQHGGGDGKGGGGISAWGGGEEGGGGGEVEEEVKEETEEEAEGKRGSSWRIR